jgi:hypothetical protein
LVSGSKILVYSGASALTIYDDKEVNFAFRAWHDWCHWQGKHPFTVEGESEACDMQCRQVYDLFGFNAQTIRWSHILKAEVLGQALYRERFGRFPTNQPLFVAH